MNWRSIGHRNRLVWALALLYLEEGVGLYQEELVAQWIILVEREVTLCLLWTGGVPIDLRRFLIPYLLMLVFL